MKRLIVALLLVIAPAMAMADPVSLVASALVAFNGTAFILGSEFLTYALATAIVFAPIAAYSSYQSSKARKAAKDAYNSGLEDRLVMAALVSGARSKVYGRARNVEGIVFKAAHGAKSEIYTLLVAVAGHEIQFVETVYFDDLPVQLDANGYVLSAPYFTNSVASASQQAGLAEGAFTLTLAHPPINATATYQFSSDTTEGGGQTIPVSLTISGSTVSGYIDTSGESSTGSGTLSIQYQWSNGASKARVREYLGNSRPDLLAGLMADIPGVLTSTDRFDGIALLRVDLTYDTDAFPSGVPSISAVIRGAKVYDPRTGVTDWSQNPALCARDWALYKYGGAMTADLIDDASVIAAANACDVSTGFYLHLSQDYRTVSTYGTGATAVVLTGGTSLVSIGMYVQFDGDPNHYLVNNTIGVGAPNTIGIAAPGLLQPLIAGVAMTASRLLQDKLFICGTVARTDQDPWVTFNEIVESMAGKAGWPGGKLRLRAGVYQAPVAAITEDWLSGVDSIQIIPEPPTDEAVNIYTPTISNGVPTSAGNAQQYGTFNTYPVGATSIRVVSSIGGTIPAGEYVQFGGDSNYYLLDNGVTASGQFLTLAAPGLLQATTVSVSVTPLGDLKTAYVAAPAPDVVASAYVTLDGRELKQDTTLSAVTDAWHAQHVCGVMLRDARNGLTVTLPCNLRAFQLELFDVVTLTLPRFGWAAKTFEVLGWQFSLSGGVTLTLKETTASIYQVDAGFSLIDQTPNTNLPDPFTVPLITGLAASSGTNQLLVQGDGTIITRILVTWDAVTDQAVLSSTRGGIVIRYGLASEDSSQWASVVLPGDATQTYLTGVQDGSFYMITAQARNSLVNGIPTPPFLHFVIGKTEPPPDVTTFAVLEQPDGRRIYTWSMDNAPPDLGGFRIRYSAPDGTAWASMIPLGEASRFERTLEMYEPRDGEYTIAIKAVDTTGNESVNELRIGVLLDATTIGTAIYVMRAQELGWPGVKDGCYVDGYQLMANSLETWDTIPITWDTWIAPWDGTAVSPIYYTDSTLDLGSVMSVHIRQSTAGVGTVTGTYQSSMDGSTWTSWAPVPAGIVSLRYVRVRWSVSGATPSLSLAQVSIYA